MAGMSENRGRRESVWFVCGYAPEVNAIRQRRGGPAAHNPINVSTQSRSQSGQSVETTTIR